MFKKCTFLLILSFFMASIVYAAYQTPSNPSDVWKMVSSIKTSDWHGVPIVVIKDDTMVDVKDNGESIMHFHKIVKLLTTEGALKEMTQIFNYDPLSSRVDIKKVIIWHDGKGQSVDLKKVKDVPEPAFMIYWGSRAKVLQLPRLYPGDAVEIYSERRGFVYALLNKGNGDFTPPMKGQFYDIVHFYSSVPIVEKTYAVNINKDKPLQYQFYKGNVEVKVRFEGKKMVYEWIKRNIKPFKREPNMVSPSDVAPKLLVTTTPTWKEKSLWFYKVNDNYPSFEVTPEIQKKVNELLKGVTSEDKKIYILTHWVAENIRYSGLSMGKGEGYTLHPGAMTFRDRCGVCKDKAGMLITMLRAAGFKSYPAMTMAGSRIENIPADQFNHCVTVVERSDGRYQLLDPTWVPGVRELWSSLEQEQQYLMGVPEGADLKTTPWSPPEKHFIRVSCNSFIDAQGNLKSHVEINADGQGDAAIRRNLLRRNLLGWIHYFESLATSIDPSAKLDSMYYTDPYNISKPMNIKLDIICNSYAIAKNGYLMFRFPSLINFFSDRATTFYRFINIKKEKRNYPIRGRCTALYEWEESIKLPLNYKVINIPKNVSISGEGVKLVRSIKQETNKIMLHKTLILKRRIFPVCMYKNLKMALERDRSDVKYVFIARSQEVK